jgi:hypothetical protein
MRLIGVLMVFAGCQNGGSAMPDTPVGTDDGSQHGLGMFVSWNANPALPGMLSDKLSVSDATFQLNHFQVVADSGGSMHSKYLLAWSAGMAPAKEMFPDATAGVYSKASLDLGGNLASFAYQIHGIWSDDKGPKPFTIEDSVPLTISIDCNKLLPAAGSAEIAIKFDLGDPLGTVSFKDLEDEDGPIEITGQSNQLVLAVFRARLPHAFKSDN